MVWKATPPPVRNKGHLHFESHIKLLGDNQLRLIKANVPASRPDRCFRDRINRYRRTRATSYDPAKLANSSPLLNRRVAKTHAIPYANHSRSDT